MDFQDGGLDFSAVRVFERDGELEDAAGLQGADGVFAFLAAVAFIDDEELVFDGVRFEVVEGLRGEAGKIMDFFGRHQLGDAFHEVAFSATALGAENS